MSRYDHKIETSLEGIEHLSKEKKEKEERKMKEKNQEQRNMKVNSCHIINSGYSCVSSLLNSSWFPKNC